MKKAIFAILSIALLVGCSNLSNSPKATVQKFYKTLEKKDYKAMADVATPETIQMMSMFGPKLEGMAAAYGKVISIEESIDGDKAVVKLKFEKGQENSIDLIKEDGKWKVAMSMNK